jgi:peptide-methionine (R)-S-oxide reductase
VTRRLPALLLGLGLLTAGLLAATRLQHQPKSRPMTDAAKLTFTPLDKPRESWRGKVSPEAYEVLFEEGTERAGTCALLKEKRPGTFLCAACYLPLFISHAKFESGTGWPSFFDPIPGRLGTKRDLKFGMVRTEYHCARCGGHQGHVFDDGPPPSGLRYCNNGVSLRFVPEGEPLPPLRD